MGNFLVTISASESQRDTRELFHSAMTLARGLAFAEPSRVLETDWVCAASFPRQNGSGAPIVSDPEAGSWLLAVGTWFHEDGYGIGAESRLLTRYKRVGAAQLGRELDGFFVIIIGDAQSRETIVLTDTIGSCHGFFRSFKRNIVLSSSSLLLAGLADFSLDTVACQEFLCTGTVYEDRTIYSDVRKLGPATVFRFSNGTLKDQRRYWHITDVAHDSLDDSHALEAVWNRLVDGAAKIGRAFAQPVCDLTGGYDSRMVIAAFMAAGVQFSTTVAGSRDSRDVVVSSELARIAGLQHLYLAPEQPTSFTEAAEAVHFTDGEFNIIEYGHILKMHRILSERFDVSINGSFGGIARGLWWELLIPRIGACTKLDAWKLAKLRYAAQPFDASIIAPELRLDYVRHFAQIIETINAGLSDLPNTLQMDNANLLMRIHRWQGRIASSTNRLWPCLSLFGLRSVLETVLQTRARLRLRSLLVRRILAEHQPVLAALPLDRGYPALPVTCRNMHCFYPAFGYLGRKVASKVSRSVRRSTRSAQSNALPTRLRFYREEQVCELLRPQHMQLACMCETNGLTAFLDRSRRANFIFDDEWARLFSLEYTLRTLKQAIPMPSRAL